MNGRDNPYSRQGLTIIKAGPQDAPEWNAYVHTHPHATAAHLFEWKKVIENTYGHETAYLMAVQGRVRGLVPLVHLKHFLFGNELVSMPFLDTGGILGNDPATEQALWAEASRFAQSKGAKALELRSPAPLHLEVFPEEDAPAVRTDKARMLLPLPPSSEELSASFKSKLRSQIRKPVKQGIQALVGGKELLHEFYRVFSVNMRELGSPVHAKALFSNILDAFPEKARLVLVRDPRGTPLAGGLILGFKKTLLNPWASSLRQYSSLSPNMLLYWQMLAHACEQSYDTFDFGRSSRSDGTYRFKAQWGAKDLPLYWYRLSLQGNSRDPGQSRLFQKASQCWKRLPVPVANFLGPSIRKHIGL